MTIQVVRPNRCVAGAVRSIHDSPVRHINPLAIDPLAIVTLPGIPIGIVDALCIAAVAARSLAAVQTLIPTVQLGVLMIMSSSTAGCKDQ